MLIKTKSFGEIDIPEEKIIHFEKGLLGLSEYKDYTILYDIEEGKEASIAWLQSVDEQSLAIPVINPLLIKEDYNPILEEELLSSLGVLTDENVVVMLTLTVPKNVKEMTINMKAPIIINSDTRRGAQMIAENRDYMVRYKIYDRIERLKQ